MFGECNEVSSELGGGGDGSSRFLLHQIIVSCAFHIITSPRCIVKVGEYELGVQSSVRNNQTDHQLSVFDKINEHADSAVDSCGET